MTLFLLMMLEITAAGATNYAEHIYPLLGKHCASCHVGSGVGFVFGSHEQVLALGPALVNAVEGRRMPPWLAKRGVVEYVDDQSLKDAEIELFSEWKAAGFPAGATDKLGTLKPTRVAEPFKSDVSLTLRDGRSYLPDQNRKDDYRCFVNRWPLQKAVYINGFEASPNNRRVAHHLVVYVANADVAADFESLDAEEPGDGYQCFGGAVPDRIAKDPTKADLVRKVDAGSAWLAHWAPGMPGYAFPKDTGIAVKPGALIITQVHYYAAFAPGESDGASKIAFSVTDKVRYPAFYHPLTNDNWLRPGTHAVEIPPGASKTFRYLERVQDLALERARDLGYDSSKITNITLHSANLHMHSYGTRGFAYLENQFGEMTTLLEIPRWDLGWQRDFQFTKPLTFSLAEAKNIHMGVECTFANSTDTKVVGGFGSDDEMCFNFAYLSLDLGN